MKKLRIAIDFDGTIVSQAYPNIGMLIDNAKETINKWYSKGHIITINTCRAGQYEDDARKFLDANDVKYHLFNENDKVLIEKYNTDCRKISADVYIDDKNLGGFVGWKIADELIEQMENEKPLIICLIGESCAGKTAASKYIERAFGIKMIESYTDREKRSENEIGHVFLSKDEFSALNKDDMIAYTDFGDRRYCCLKQDVLDYNTYVIDESGLQMLREKYSDIYNIKAIRLRCDKEERIRRGGKERVDRDKNRFTLHWTEFDCEVNTNQPKYCTNKTVGIFVTKFLNEARPYSYRRVLKELEVNRLL